MKIELPRPPRRGGHPLEDLIRRRRSVREYTDRPLTPGELSRLLWSLQGVTDPEGLRAAPSAGAVYPLEIHVVLETGVYHYDPKKHRVTRSASGDKRAELSAASLGQECVAEAPAVFVIAAVRKRMERKYGRRWSPRYINMEVGHASQNLLLEAVALGLAAVPVAAFQSPRVGRILSVPSGQEVLYLIPVGQPR